MGKHVTETVQDSGSARSTMVFGSITIAGSLVLGAIVAFVVGAHAGARLDSTTRSVSVGQVQITPVAQR